MNRKERNLLTEFPYALDKAVTERFGVPCESSFDLFGSMQWTTHYGGEGEEKERVKAFIDGYLAGNKELVTRLENLNQKQP